MPFVYILVLTSLALMCLKLTCWCRLRLLLSLVTISSNLETVSLLTAIVYCIKEVASAPVESRNDTIIAMVLLLGSLITFLALNVYMAIALRTSFKAIINKDKTVVLRVFSTKFDSSVLTLVTLLSIPALSFHNLTWFNCSGGMSKSTTTELFSPELLKKYKFVCKVSLLVPRLVI